MKNIIYIVLAISLIACSSKKEATTEKSENTAQVQMLAQTIIYKTKKDFSQLVPVQMNKERTKIVAYPSPKDLMKSGELQTPIVLDKGYYLDRRGVNTNTVFINMTYEAYAALKKAPPVSEMKELIVEKDPFVEMYVCPDLKQNASVEEMNKVVASGCKSCKRIK
jgi:hypothetical protein